jgi:hypothetical protein
MSKSKEYKGPIVEGYRYRIVGSGREWFGEVVGVPQVTGVHAKTKYAVKSLLRRDIRKYVWGCYACGVIPKRSYNPRGLLCSLDKDGLLNEETVSVASLFERYGAVFTDVMWLFSRERSVINKDFFKLVCLDASVVGERLMLLIDTSRFGGECSILGQPYPEHFSVSVDNARRVIEIHFSDVVKLDNKYWFNVHVETSDGLIVDTVNIIRSGEEKDFVFYGYMTLSRERFFSFNRRIFEFFRSAFFLQEKINGKDVRGVAICAHAFANAISGRAYFQDLRMDLFLKECCDKAAVHLEKFHFITGDEEGRARLFRWRELNGLRSALQWFDSRVVHADEYYKSMACRLWKEARGRGDDLENAIIDIIAMRYENKKNIDIYNNVMKMLVSSGKGKDINKRLGFDQTKNGPQKISNFLKSVPLKTFVEKNLFPQVLSKEKKRRCAERNV